MTSSSENQGKLSQTEKSWALYDWANSAFATTVMAGFFQLFFQKYWSAGESSLITTSRLGVVLALSGLTATLLTLIIGPRSDRRGSRKKWTLVFGFLGMISTFLLMFFPQGQWQGPLVLYALALTGFTLSCNFYDSLLPHVTTEQRMGRVSSVGYSWGYLGGGLLFTLNVFMYLKPEFFFLPDGPAAIRASFALVALWWLVFSFPLIKNVKEQKSPGDDFLPWAQIWTLIQKARQRKKLFYFLLAFWFYIDGVYTVMSMAVDFGVSIGLDGAALMGALLMTQFVAFPFTLLAGKLAEKVGAERMLIILVGIYILTVIGATQLTTNIHFFILAFMIGMAQGGVQALSRSQLALMIPAQESGQWYALMNVVGRFAAVVGPLLVALTTQVTQSHRWGILSISLLLLLGIFFLIRSRRAL